MMGEELLLWEDLVRVACMGVMKLAWWWLWWCVWDLPCEEWEEWEVGDGEEATGEGGQKDCRAGWGVELERDCEEGDEEGVMLLLTTLTLLLMPLVLALLFASP